MSLTDYIQGRELNLHCLNNDIDFYAVLQCLIRMADTDNLEHIKYAWPDRVVELTDRYNAPEGKLEGDKE